jgi:hypothetical protein
MCRGAGCKILVFVTENAVSRMAFKAGKQMLRWDKDELHLVYVIPPDRPQDYGHTLLASFNDPLCSSQIRRHVRLPPR